MGGGGVHIFGDDDLRLYFCLFQPWIRFGKVVVQVEFSGAVRLLPCSFPSSATRNKNNGRSSAVLSMGLSKTEVNLRRLLEAAPRQQNQTKLVHYITTLREQLEQLSAETTPTGTPSISKAKVNEYSEKIEALAAKLATPLAEPEDLTHEAKEEEGTSSTEQTVDYKNLSPGLRRRTISQVATKGGSHEAKEKDSTGPVKLDASGFAHIAKHRKLQEDLTDEMVGLARQLKESSLLMNRSLENTEKILDSTERAVEHSLASTNRANKRAMEVYSESSKTTCFTWLLLFLMTCVFIMVVLLIRVT